MNQRLHVSEAVLTPLAGEVVEIPLLLPGWQAQVLETVAHDQGLTAAEMVRGLLRDFISRLSANQPDVVLASARD